MYLNLQIGTERPPQTECHLFRDSQITISFDRRCWILWQEYRVPQEQKPCLFSEMPLVMTGGICHLRLAFRTLTFSAWCFYQVLGPKLLSH